MEVNKKYWSGYGKIRNTWSLLPGGLQVAAVLKIRLKILSVADWSRTTGHRPPRAPRASVMCISFNFSQQSGLL